MSHCNKTLISRQGVNSQILTQNLQTLDELLTYPVIIELVKRGLGMLGPLFFYGNTFNPQPSIFPPFCLIFGSIIS